MLTASSLVLRVDQGRVVSKRNGHPDRDCIQHSGLMLTITKSYVEELDL